MISMKIAIIGAGAAGLMCACHIRTEHTVLIFDKNAESGRKLLLTGNGRCNLTNLVEPAEFLKSVPQGAEFLKHSIYNFNSQHAINFFNNLGVESVVEDNNRVFPKQGRAGGVRQVLETYARNCGVQFKFGHTITNIESNRGGFVVKTNGESFSFDAVIIATGGLSFPKIGSTGDGFEFAKNLGHTIITLRPALCGLQFETPTGFQGVSVPVSATLGCYTEQGSIMFTKNGVGGPIIFKLTSELKESSINGQELIIDFVPNIKNPTFDPKDKPFYAFRKYLPQNVANWLVARGDKPKDIKSIRVAIKDFDPIDTATITRGGVDTAQINPETMESKIVPNLYFIGEVLNVDGLSGGFNLQIAWSTATTCARSFK